MILIKNGLIIPDATTKPFRGHIVIDGGSIISIDVNLPENAEGFSQIIDAEGKVVMPGFINAHTHSYANFVKGMEENLPLETMMFHIVTQGIFQTPEDVYHNTMLGAVEMLKNGITSCLDQLAQNGDGLDAAMTAYEKIGMRVLVAPMITDLGYFETLPVSPKLVPDSMQGKKPTNLEELMNTSIGLLKKWHGKHDRLKVGFGPSGPQRASDDLLKACMAAAIEYDTIFHTHTLETQTQRNTAHYLYGKPMVLHLNDIGCLNERTSMAHTVWMTREEALLAKEKGAIAVHCPACNMFLGSGIAPINMYREIGWPNGLGTDGANGGGNQNLLETMKITALIHKVSEVDHNKWIKASEVFAMATVNNASVLAESKRLGTLEKDKLADIVIMDPAKSLSMQPMQDVVAQIVYGEGGAAVDTVLVHGQVVLSDGKCTLVDEKEVFEICAEKAKKLEEKIRGKDEEVNEEIKFLESVLPRLG